MYSTDETSGVDGTGFGFLFPEALAEAVPLVDVLD